jgi:hypothetical protein
VFQDLTGPVRAAARIPRSGTVVPPRGDSPRRQSQLSPTSFTAFLASNLLAQFSRQIVIQIFSSESKKSLWQSRSLFTLVKKEKKNEKKNGFTPLGMASQYRRI